VGSWLLSVETIESYNEQKAVCFKRNVKAIYVFAVPALIVITILMAIFAHWKNGNLVSTAFLSAAGIALSMAYRQRKLEGWVFTRGQRRITLGGILFLAFIIFGIFCVYLTPYTGPAMSLLTSAYLISANLAIFHTVDRMEKPDSKEFAGEIEKERKRSIFRLFRWLQEELVTNSWVRHLFGELVQHLQNTRDRLRLDTSVAGCTRPVPRRIALMKGLVKPEKLTII